MALGKVTLNIRNKEAFEHEIRTQEILTWIEKVLNEPLPYADDGIQQALGDGVALCKLMTAIFPNQQLIPKYNPPNSFKWKLMENVGFFVKAMEKLGFPQIELFEPSDLVDGDNLPKVVNTIHKLAEFVCSKGFKIKIIRFGEDDRILDQSKVDLENIRKRNLNQDPSIDILLEEVNKKIEGDPVKNSILHIAIEIGQPVLVAHLVAETPKDLNVQNQNGLTPLHVACKSGNSTIVEELLRNGANVTIRDLEGKTALHYAAKEGKTRIIELLAEKGADLDAQDSNQNTPLHNAKNKYATLRLMNLGADVNKTNMEGATALSIAVERGEQDVVEVLAEFKETNLDLQRTDGRTPLYTASYLGYIETVQVLVSDKRVNVNAQEKHGWSPLHAAAYKGHDNIVKYLLQQPSIQKDIQSTQGTTPLYHASESGKIKCVELLVESGADVNLGARGGWLPVHGACTKGYFSIVKYLVHQGAKIDESNAQEGGYNLLHMVISQKKPNLEIIRDLIQKGADINLPVKSTGSTPLHLAVYFNHLSIVQELVRLNARLDAKNTRGRTPLQLAAYFGYSEIAEFLAKELNVPVPKMKHKERNEGVVETPKVPPPPQKSRTKI
eukprot:TRINITY_DN13787_c0_g1_i1.p1 TRINITY_DN13787_c0_g1~~TRINITY_DN13787_c0_g1_i1.p1  ORF type:complete len:611 (-),score=110.35 TRINITY_DN13787_c0_g1_i1:99-1931(-)